MADKQQANSQPAAGQASDVLPKPEFHIMDMSKEEAEFAEKTAKKGLYDLFTNQSHSFCDVAQYIKQEFDKKGGTWHVFVGKHFGAWVTYEAHKLAYFHIGQAAFLIYKHG
mmetsp:Transcript_72412/g.204698  ORF Transcript_72412/g.204698 Transcript_72412/m.204698 type:complete len:111 (-) Transcript_72412:159-491(-)